MYYHSQDCYIYSYYTVVYYLIRAVHIFGLVATVIILIPCTRKHILWKYRQACCCEVLICMNFCYHNLVK